MDLVQFQQNLRGIDVWEILKPILKKHLEEAEQLNREQLKAGLQADGNPTKPHSGGMMSQIYVEGKIQRGVYDESIYPSVNLYNTGAFHKSINAIVQDFGLEFNSDDSKFSELEKRYSTLITGLGDEYLAMWTEKWKSEFIEALKKAMLHD